jgi:hypothetical protein
MNKFVCKNQLMEIVSKTVFSAFKTSGDRFDREEKVYQGGFGWRLD